MNMDNIMRRVASCGRISCVSEIHLWFFLFFLYYIISVDGITLG